MSQILHDTAELDVLTLPTPAVPRRPVVVVAARTPLMRINLTVSLEEAGFDVWAVASGVEVFETCLLQQEVNVLLLEADLPGLPAPTLFERLRRFFPSLSCCFFAAAPGGRITDEVLAMAATVFLWPTPVERVAKDLWAAVCGRSARSASR